MCGYLVLLELRKDLIVLRGKLNLALHTYITSKSLNTGLYLFLDRVYLSLQLLRLFAESLLLSLVSGLDLLKLEEIGV